MNNQITSVPERQSTAQSLLQGDRPPRPDSRLQSPTVKGGGVSKVNWSAYATQYDLMAERNPAYQELLDHCVSTVRQWPLRAGDAIADFGAGTGNFSIALARALPEASVLHLELDAQMLAVAEAKAK